VVFAASSWDVAGCGLGDLAICEELKLPAEHRSVRQDASGEELRQVAAAVLRDWAERYGG